MSTHIPRPAYDEAELATLYPPGLRLQQVQILMRHGERTPVKARFENTGVPAYWPYCTVARQMRSAILNPQTLSVSTLEWKRQLEAFGPGDLFQPARGPAGEVDALCDYGMLTDRGRQTTFDLGSRLRKLYVEQLAFLPATMETNDLLFLRSTHIPRALESLQQTYSGLYPIHTRAPQLPMPTIVTRLLDHEQLLPNETACRRLAALARAFSQRAADKWNDTEEMAYLNKKIGKWMPDHSPKVAVDSHPRLVGIVDSINATNAHGPRTKLPKEFYDPKVKEIAEKIVVDEWFSGYRESQEYRSVGIGSLLGDVVQRMVSSVEANTQSSSKTTATTPQPFRLGLSGCHDTTIAATLASLGAYNTDSWPPFTSHIAIELFRKHDNATNEASSVPSSSASWLPSFLSSDSKQVTIGRKSITELNDTQKSTLREYYVRLKYNDEPVHIPGCKPAGNHFRGDESFCTLEAFKSIVDKFTPRDWRAQCAANVKAPAFPAKIEPAGY